MGPAGRRAAPVGGWRFAADASRWSDDAASRTSGAGTSGPAGADRGNRLARTASELADWPPAIRGGADRGHRCNRLAGMLEQKLRRPVGYLNAAMELDFYEAPFIANC